MSVNLGNAREDEQLEVMRKFAEAGLCPFCPEQLAQLENQPVLYENESWVVLENRWPYEHLRVHLLFILKRHIEHLVEIKVEEFTDLLGAIKWAEQTYSVASGAVAMRFGDPNHNGASVHHLHLHFMAGDCSGNKCRIKVAQ